MPAPTEQSAADGTRERLIHAALKVFGELGFNGASTRKLAAEAGVNLASIPYHFGGKEGLYLAVAEYVAGRIGDQLLPIVAEINAVLDSKPDRQTVVHLLHKLMGSFARLIIVDREADDWAALIMREQNNPTAAFDVLYRNCMQHVSMAINRLTGAILNKPPDDPETIIQSTTMVGQFMIFRTSRAAVLRRLGWDEYSEQNMQPVVDTILRNIDACLGIAVPEAP